MFPENRLCSAPLCSAMLCIGSGPVGWQTGWLADSVECACIHYYSGVCPTGESDKSVDFKQAGPSCLSPASLSLYGTCLFIGHVVARLYPRTLRSLRVPEVLIKQEINRVRAFTDITLTDFNRTRGILYFFSVKIVYSLVIYFFIRYYSEFWQY